MFIETSSCEINSCLSEGILSVRIQKRKFYSELEQLWSQQIDYFRFLKTVNNFCKMNVFVLYIVNFL